MTSSTQGRHGPRNSWRGLFRLQMGHHRLDEIWAALEFGQYGITVNAVISGLIDTPLTRHHDRYAQAADGFQIPARAQR